MAEPKKVTFYSTEPDAELFFPDRSPGGVDELIRFKDGKFETSNPGYITTLEELADTDAHPITRRAPSTEKK